MKVKSSSFTKSLLKKDKLVPHLDQAISQGDFEWTFDYKPKQGDDAWHPSGDCMPSPLDLYGRAKGLGEAETYKTSMYKTFMVGHFWHAYIQTVLVENELAEPEAIERVGEERWGIGPFEWARGSGDVAPVKIPKHGEYLCDIKTMNSFDFNQRTIPEWTKHKWECQVNVYMDFFDMEKAIILGVQKDSPHLFKEFEFHRNQALVDAIYLKWKLVSQCLREDVMPPPDEDIDLPLKGPVVR